MLLAMYLRNRRTAVFMGHSLFHLPSVRESVSEQRWDMDYERAGELSTHVPF